MRKIALIASFLLLLAMTSSASAIGIRGGLVLCNSNYFDKYSGMEKTVDLDLHYGIEVDISFPVTPMIEILGGLTYYLPVGGKLDDTGYYPSDQKVAFLPINIAAKFNIPNMGMSGMNPYAGLGLNYTNWVWDPEIETYTTPGLGYFGFVGATFGNLFGELGYTIMTATQPHDDVYTESRGIYVKGGMVLEL